jgi:hypothetical protein
MKVDSGIGLLAEYTECQAFYPVVLIGSPHRPWVQGGETHSLAGGGGVGTQFPDDGTDNLVLQGLPM